MGVKKKVIRLLYYLPMERMSNFINAQVEELREHLKKYYDETIYLETRLDRAKKDNEKLEKENKKLKEYNGELIENHKKDIAILCEENKKLKEKLSEITMVADDEKQSIEHILELEKENEELKKQNDRLTTQIAKQLLKNV